MAQHIDSSCNQAIGRLNDKICSYERTTGNGYTVLVIPHHGDEDVIGSVNGKPVPEDMTPEEIFEVAMGRRKKQ